MAINIWSASAKVFSSTDPIFSNVDWQRSRAIQSAFPNIVDAETPATAFNASGPNRYGVYLTAQNWLGQIQSPVAISGNFTNISVPFAIAAGTSFGATNNVFNDALLTWQASASNPGAYDIVLSPFSYQRGNVDSGSPALQFSGTQTIIANAVANPLAWAFANSANKLVYLYATAAGSSETLNTVVYDASTGAVTAPLAVAVGVPDKSFFYDFYSAPNSAFVLVQTATQNGVHGVDFSTISTADGSPGAPVFQAFTPGNVWDPNNTGLSDFAMPQVKLAPLANGDYLEFVEWEGSASGLWNQNIETRLLDSNFSDISQTTSGFSAAKLLISTNADHWATTTLANGVTVLVVDTGGLVEIHEFDPKGNAFGPIMVLERVDIHFVHMNALTMDSMDRNARGVCS